MRFFRRSLIALGIAASVPTVLFVAVVAFALLRGESRRVENETLERARIVMELADARLQADVAALTMLTGSTHLQARNWPELCLRLQQALAKTPHWVTIAVYDAATRTAVFDLRHPYGTSTATLERDTLTRLQASAGPVVGNMSTNGEPLAWIYVPVPSGTAVEYVLAAAIRPTIFQEMIAPQARHDVVAALVDRNGIIAARSLDPERRVGRPATVYTRNAIASGSHGLYRGRTFENLRNYTAFYTSSWSGWSTHLSIASGLIDTPISWSIVVLATAGLGALLLGGTLIVIVLRDMAERRRAEEALRHSQKMEAIGQLTGGIAHDFNNLLTAIIGNLDLIHTRAAGNERLQRLASNALEAARRGAKLATQLLAFSRNQRMQLAPVSLTRLLGGMRDLLAQSVGPTVELHTHIDPEADSVLSDADQLELALLNLAVNARDAIPNGGVIEIDVRPAAQRDIRGLQKRPYVAISVKDNGKGMPETVRARAMEPFFTTKPVGQGTGLGLSQVYGTVRESGGLVFIESTPGEGTTVRMILPAAPPIAAMTTSPWEGTPTVPTPSSNVTTSILVVDDDRQVRRFIAESLRSQGYAVTDVPSGEAGLTALKSSRFDLLVADFAMPGMNGAELVREARRLQPDIRVLIASGYADSAALAEVLGDDRVLRKPFAVAELTAAVNATLARALTRREE